MLKLEPIEFLLRTLPEGFLFILAIYTFSKVKVDGNKYIISSMICSLTIFFVRILPISYGIHTIITIGIVIILAVYINKIDIIKCIKSVLIFTIVQFLSEGLNIFIIQGICKVDMNEVFLDPVLKNIYGLPSLVILGVVILTYYIIILKRDELTSV